MVPRMGPHLAGQRDLCPLQAAALGNLHRPALECGEARQPAQHRIRSQGLEPVPLVLYAKMPARVVSHDRLAWR